MVKELSMVVYLTVISNNTGYLSPNIKQFEMPDMKTCTEVLKETKQVTNLVEEGDALDHLSTVTITCSGKMIRSYQLHDAHYS